MKEEQVNTNGAPQYEEIKYPKIKRRIFSCDMSYLEDSDVISDGWHPFK